MSLSSIVFPRGACSWLPHFGLALLTMLLVAGCQPEVVVTEVKQVELTVTSEPAGAEVTVDGAPRSYATPFTLSVDQEGHMLEFRLEGHRTTWRRVPPGAENQDIAVRLEPASAVVYLDSVPTGTSLTLDGVRIGQTPVFVPEVKLGPHKAELELAGYDKREFTFDLTDQRPKRFTTSLVSIMGSLRLHAETPEVTIYLDGTLVGVTPPDGVSSLHVPEVKEGEHEILGKKTNFQDIRQTVTVRRREIKVVTLPRLVELPGGLEVTSNPDAASVYINGDLRGKTPFLLNNQIPGKALVKIEKEGFDPQVREVEISPNFTRRLQFNLVRNVGGITLTTRPPDCFVYVDGKVQRAKTERSDPTSLISRPFLVDGLPEGTHLIRVENALYEAKDIRILLQRGEMKNLGLIELDEKWLPTHNIMLKDGSQKKVRMNAERPDGSIEVWISKQIKVEYRPGEIVKITPID
jgi:hypothetical protein